MGLYGEAQLGTDLANAVPKKTAATPSVPFMGPSDPHRTLVNPAGIPSNCTFTVLPNPAIDVVVIHPTYPGTGFLLGAWLQDSGGTTIHSNSQPGSNNSVAIEVGDLPRGHYTILVRTTAGSFVRPMDLI